VGVILKGGAKNLLSDRAVKEMPPNHECGARMFRSRGIDERSVLFCVCGRELDPETHVPVWERDNLKKG
jgi:hypothetical protein